MATPSYKGPNQPTADNGFWSGFGSFFGGGTPAYKGDGQPSTGASGFLGSVKPAYKSVPSDSARTIDPSSFPQGPFAIVVPRGFVPPCDENDPQQ
jgi:hypothetical protein